ncbi:curlin [Shewanella hanedai]|uniref:Curlin n=1 Tax=Shewanella hanedai TaxID=25 RepID=A0A553JUQ5_SHEHA|nr:curlin [Shewanella hanedai]TRY16182.1 curlin [Shewanella hanedai]GGI67043.1 curlin [Shewanella hanedai]
MSILNSVFLLFITLCFSTWVLADDDLDTSSTYELPVTLQSLLESNGRENLVNLVQLGNLNTAHIIQLGSHNYTDLLQLGDNNEADVAQYGKNNQVELIQVGDDNQASITQVGNNNQVNLNQLGSANFSIEQIADGAEITITQY